MTRSGVEEKLSCLGGFRLVTTEAEAVCVRAIFELYLEHQSLLPVV
jgi:hypothetical protein